MHASSRYVEIHKSLSKEYAVGVPDRKFEWINYNPAKLYTFSLPKLITAKLLHALAPHSLLCKIDSPTNSYINNLTTCATIKIYSNIRCVYCLIMPAIIRK
jgi:hypothetical protein